MPLQVDLNKKACHILYIPLTPTTPQQAPNKERAETSDVGVQNFEPQQTNEPQQKTIQTIPLTPTTPQPAPNKERAETSVRRR